MKFSVIVIHFFTSSSNTYYGGDLEIICLTVATHSVGHCEKWRSLQLAKFYVDRSIFGDSHKKTQN